MDVLHLIDWLVNEAGIPKEHIKKDLWVKHKIDGAKIKQYVKNV
jgi:hypothetical protein